MVAGMRGREMTTWEVDWAHPQNTGTRMWARNPSSRQQRTRRWHWVLTSRLRQCGINTPTYRKDSWEIDWSKRKSKKVWARNPYSKMPSAREWHWIDQSTVQRAGLKWKPKTELRGRYITSYGYVNLTRKGMTDDDIALAEQHGLFRGQRKTFVKEHHLVAVKKYGAIPDGAVVKHFNGIKHDNSPDNLLLGTTQENTADHNTARLQAMYWREQYEEAQKEIERLKGMLERDPTACIGIIRDALADVLPS